MQARTRQHRQTGNEGITSPTGCQTEQLYEPRYDQKQQILASHGNILPNQHQADNKRTAQRRTSREVAT